MKSIDLLAPPTENDNTPQIELPNTNELVEKLVGTVSELVDVQTETTNKLVEKMTDVINNANVSRETSDDPQDTSTGESEE